MISTDEIDKNINELLEQKASYQVCEKLACLYTVRDHLAAPSTNVTAFCKCDGSELHDAVSGKDIQTVLDILNEHLCALKCVFPKEYDEVINRLKNA